ncbi:hypothetical protein Prudu_35S000900 [Prunus dulcis]|uniref:Uncharacterized protein n=1 Tax=Prunus dulcis TaxID=3755 RepID=A0A5H2XFL7_PRUDU|nr:hypothetical protein Prudu_35S000900 [Prunus dulcis]
MIKLDHRQSNLTHQARNKMVAAQHRTEWSRQRKLNTHECRKNSILTSSTDFEVLGVTSFKVYSESETTNAEANSRSSVPVNKASTLENTIAIKAGLKTKDKRKGILGSSTGIYVQNC